ncbi:MAG: glycosyltransferase [Candidatus Sumerlaeia bacterium]|nr:glycosyltransferase [Candidatus Sumerlaeia bacterium]
MSEGTGNKKIKIVFVIGSLNLGGAEGQLAELAIRLDKNIFDVEICCIAQGGPLMELVSRHGIKIRVFKFYLVRGKYSPYSYFHLPRELWRIYRYFKETKPDIVHAFLYTAYIVGILCARLAKVPVTIASRRSLGYFKENNILKQPLENFINKLTDYVLVNSEAVRQDVLRREKIDPNKIHLIYNGVDLTKFQTHSDLSELRAQLNLTEDNLVVGVVANLIHYKGHKELIEAARILKPRFPKLKFVFVGRDGGMKAELEQLTKNYTLNDTIIFTGGRRDVPELMQMFDIVALASYEEGFSNVILEAMASGKPVIATNVGGNPEAVVHGETGLIVPPRSASALAAAIEQLLTDSLLRKTMGEKGRQRVKQLFSIDRLLTEMQKFYLDAITRIKQPR